MLSKLFLICVNHYYLSTNFFLNASHKLQWVAFSVLTAIKKQTSHSFYVSVRLIQVHKSRVFSVDVTSRWREDWQSATEVNSTLVVDPQSDFPVLIFTDVIGHCWIVFAQADNELCDCGEIQTMSHIVNSCPLTKFDGRWGCRRLADNIWLLVIIINVCEMKSLCTKRYCKCIFICGLWMLL